MNLNDERRLTCALVFGTGEYARWTAKVLGELDVEIEGFLVQDGKPESVDGRPTWRTYECPERLHSLPVILGVFNPQTNLHEVIKDMQLCGFQSFLTPPSVFSLLAENGVDARRYWLDTESLLINHLGDILNEVQPLWDDSEGRSIFSSHLLYRSTGAWCYSWLPRPTIQQYADQHLLKLIESKPGLLVDCGAFTGDSIENWVAHGIHDREVLAIEPEAENITELRARTQGIGTLRCQILEAGVGSTSGRASLQGSGISARLVADPQGTLNVVSLDDVLGDAPVSLIKMDIEGAELSALEGGANVIARERPILAISVYHTPTDWWGVPQTIAAWNLDYSFRLRSYGHQGYDTVLYAYPRTIL